MKNSVLALFATLALAAPGFGQPQPPVRKLIQLQHVQVEEVANLLGGMPTWQSRELGALVLQGTAEEVAKAEEIIRAVDRPGAGNASEGSVELDAYFLSAGSESSGGPVPPLVEPVVAELKKRFNYTHYGLLDSTLVQVSIGTGAAVDGQFTGTAELPTSYSLAARPIRVSGEPGSRTIRLNQVIAVWKIPYRTQHSDPQTGHTSYQTFTRDLRIATDVSVPEGKLVVVGKAGSPTSAEAIFLVLRARLVE